MVLLAGSTITRVLVFFPTETERNDVGTCWRQEILLYTYWWPSPGCYYLCHSVKTVSCPKKRAWLSVPHLLHFFWSQAHTALRNSCIHSSARCTSVSWELVLERYSPTVRGWWGGTGNCAQPGWDKSGPGQSPLLLLWGWNAAYLTQYI